MGGECSMQGKEVKCHNILVGKPEFKREIGRPMRKKEYDKYEKI
jgi:hypothetical protein